VAGRKKDVDEALLGAFTAGSTAIDAARVAKCSVNTARRRLADPVFAERLKNTKAEMLQHVVARLASIGRLSVDVLHGLLQSKNERIRLGAAKNALAALFRGKEVLNLADELEDLRVIVEKLAGDRQS
jgi:hypothetical protein